MTKWRYLLLFLVPLLLFACKDDDPILGASGETSSETGGETTGYHDAQGNFNYKSLIDDISDSVQLYKSPAYPFNADTLHILAIGNSFSDDALQYLDDLVKQSGINPARLCVYATSIGAATFDRWLSAFTSKEEITMYHKAGYRFMPKEKGTMQQLLHQPWDIVVIQQASDKSYMWDTFKNLKTYIDSITSNCLKKDVCLAYQMVWSHTMAEMPHVLQGNIACCQKMMKRYGIDVVIPVGTAIQLARGTYLNDDMYLTRDNWHLNYGMGRYIAACTWFETMLTPLFHITVKYNPLMPNGNYTEADALEGRKCAVRAVDNPFTWQ